MKYFNYILSTILFTGCGSTDGRFKDSFASIFTNSNHNDAVTTPSMTADALSIFVYIGATVCLVGVIMFIIGARHMGIVTALSGIAMAASGHLIEEYSLFVLAALFYYVSCFALFKMGILWEKKGHIIKQPFMEKEQHQNE